MPTEPSRLSVTTASPLAGALHPAHLVWERGCAGSLLGLVVGPLSAGVLLNYLPTVFAHPISIWLAISLGGLISSAFQGLFIRKAISAPWIWLLTSTLIWLALGCSIYWLLRWQTSVLGLGVAALANGVVSVGQSVVIRERLPSAWQWVLMNTVLGGLVWGLPLLIVGVLKP
jgi:hypothetical protein